MYIVCTKYGFIHALVKCFVRRKCRPVLMPREAGMFIAVHAVDIKIKQDGIDRTVDMVRFH